MNYKDTTANTSAEEEYSTVSYEKKREIVNSKYIDIKLSQAQSNLGTSNNTASSNNKTISKRSLIVFIVALVVFVVVITIASSTITASVLKQEFAREPKVLQVEGSSTFVRWGRTTCPGNGTERVYEGYAGGSHNSHSGGAVDYLCLPMDPDWGHYEDALQSGGLVYGAEYEYTQRASSHEFFDSQTTTLVNNDVPCAVCQSSRSSVLMVPAKNQCHPGWTHEYHGYLSTGNYRNVAASEFVCVDGEADLVPGGKTTSDDGKLFYFVEGRCGSLPCPPYVNGRELTCVVCTK